MVFTNIKLGCNVDIDPSTTINNVDIHDGVKIAKHCSIFGAPSNLIVIDSNSYIGMNSILNGYSAKLAIGKNVSIAQNVNIMCDSGPNASKVMQQLFPIIKGPVRIGNHCWIGASTIILPNVTIEDYCIIAANSFVNKSFDSFSIIGGTPAKLIRKLTEKEIEILIKNNDKTSEFLENK